MKKDPKAKGKEALRKIRSMLKKEGLAIPSQELARMIASAKRRESYNEGILKND